MPRTRCSWFRGPRARTRAFITRHAAPHTDEERAHTRTRTNAVFSHIPFRHDTRHFLLNTAASMLAYSIANHNMSRHACIYMCTTHIFGRILTISNACHRSAYGRTHRLLPSANMSFPPLCSHGQIPTPWPVSPFSLSGWFVGPFSQSEAAAANASATTSSDA